jgi:hypothetical protein
MSLSLGFFGFAEREEVIELRRETRDKLKDQGNP